MCLSHVCLMCAKLVSSPQEIDEFLFASNKKKNMEESPRYTEENEELLAVEK